MTDAERELKTALEEELSNHDWAGTDSVSIDWLTVELGDWNGDAATAAHAIAEQIISAAGGESSK